MQRAYYSNTISVFCRQSVDTILGELARNNEFELEKKQRNSWLSEVSLLQDALSIYSESGIAFEYTVPRIGNRLDTVLAIRGILYIIEFKIGNDSYLNQAIDQVTDYALDLKYFHKESHQKQIVPILVCTEAPNFSNTIFKDEDGVYKPILCNKYTLKSELMKLTDNLSDNPINFDCWLGSQYMPTPTIIEAAQALYHGHRVKDISRSDSEAFNLSLTTETINQIIDKSKTNKEKSICFITGVPGAGKTLAGLNMANVRHNFDENEHAVFLSGNGPLVLVLTEALARDEFSRSRGSVSKGTARKKVGAFIQNIHHFRDEALKSSSPPIEKVVIFDEAQRAWTREKTGKFMAERGEIEWNMSEPEFLINIMDRHKDWAVIICLVGGGQEINTGEAGLPEWFEALRSHFLHWKVYIPSQLADDEYTREIPLNQLLNGINVITQEKLHLGVSIRSFRNEHVSAFVKALLDIDIEKAKRLYAIFKLKYPIVMTRDLNTAREWIRRKARGTERYGITASSGAKRLRTLGIWVQSNITPEYWFLNDKDDVRSCYFLEDTATEFDIQGLELDWAIVAWDADFRIENGRFISYNFTGTKWNRVKKKEDQLYLKNAYRVLLTRARQGMIIFVPEGNEDDYTRQNQFYDNTYNYLKSIGIQELLLPEQSR
jgi:hypothetical protein